MRVVVCFLQDSIPILFNGTRRTPVQDAKNATEGGDARYRIGNAWVPAGERRGTALGRRGDGWGKGGYRNGEMGEPVEGFLAKWGK